jgi:hypothetical protein
MLYPLSYGTVNFLTITLYFWKHVISESWARTVVALQCVIA